MIIIDDDFLSLDEAADSVDALVSDDTLDRILRPDSVAQSTTSVTAPPGFDVSLAHPSPNFGSVASPVPSRLATITPALPKVPPGLSRPVTPATPDQPSRIATPTSEAKKSIKALASQSGLSKTILSHAHPEPSALHDEDFPALNAPTPKLARNKDLPSRVGTPVSTPKSTPGPKKQAEKTLAKTPVKTPDSPSIQPAVPAKMFEKKRKAIVLNLSTADLAGSKTAESSPSVSKSTAAPAAAFPPLPTPSAGTSSPVRAPKTLRVVPTSKNELPPVASPVFAIQRALSMSIRPDTPTSEMVSDTASIVSGSVSVSRAGSPPPSRIGSAAVRTATKSQQRKQRKDALKQDTQAITEAAKEELLEEEHAPVIGRKKKQKKEKEKSAKAVASRASTPAPESFKDQAHEAEEATPEKKLEEKTVTEPVTPLKTPVKKKGKASELEKVKPREAPRQEPPKPTPPPAPKATVDDEEEEEPQAGPASIFRDVRSSLWTSAIESLYMLKPLTTGSSRADHSRRQSITAAGDDASHCKDCVCKCGEIQDADLAALRAGQPVRKQFHVDGSRMLITPNGDCIRGLTAEEEEAFLGLQAAIAATAENPGAFIAPRHQPGSGAFSLIKGRAVPNGRPNIFPATTQPQSQDPIGKLQREDALSYINQYVLPRLNLGATNVGWPKGAALRQDAAAASLNSLAPYFYGPDAAAGVGIYSAPDGKDFHAPPEVVGNGAGIGGNAGGVSGMPLMSVEDAEGALSVARRETEKLEKGLNQVIKRNRRLLLN